MAALFDRHRHAVERVCTAQLRCDPDSVDDIVQETFLRLFRSASQIREPDRVLAWLRRTAKRACIDHRRRAYRRAEQAVHGHPEASLVEPDLSEHLDRSHHVARILDAVGPKKASLLRAHYLHGWPIAEIAKHLASTSGSVKTQLYTARRDGARVQGLVPLPFLAWFRRAAATLKSTGPAVTASILAPVLVIGTLVPHPEPANASASDALIAQHSSADSERAASPLPFEHPPEGGRADEIRAPDIPPPTLEPLSAPPVNPTQYVPPPSSTRVVTVPGTDLAVETYQEPEGPPDRRVAVQIDGAGEVVGLDAYDEPATYPYIDALCAAEARPGPITCSASDS